jgi:quercetin dioxygenase-like cupin family protein
MSGFTIKNLMDVDDSAGEYAPQLEARFARKHIGSEHLGVSYMRFAAGYRFPLGHSHTMQEEAYVVVAGSGWIKLDDEIFALDRWDVVRVAPDPVRSFEAGPDGLEIIAVGADRPEGGDGLMIRDWWTEREPRERPGVTTKSLTTVQKPESEEN